MSMLRAFSGVKNFISNLAAICLIFAIGGGMYALNACKLRAIEGERTFYLDSASSQGLTKRELSFGDFLRITGESVRFDLEGKNGENLAKEIAEKYNAEVLFTEEAGGVLSYYCYTPAWEESVLINGQKINLHVAVSQTQCAVGTPIIFGGF